MPQELPERPNLEQLKKQAKSLLHAAQAGEAAALQRFAALPAFSKKSILDLGALGLVLNRPSTSTVASAVPQLEELAETGDPVFVGGPVQSGAVVMLAEFEDPAAAAKVATKMAKAEEKFVIKGGYVDGRALDVKGVEALSNLPGKDELRATFLATLLAVPQNFLRLTTAAADRRQPQRLTMLTMQSAIHQTATPRDIGSVGRDLRSMYPSTPLAKTPSASQRQ